MFRLILLIWCAFLWVLNCRASDISYLDRGSILEKDIAAVFNKVAYGGVTTTKRSISSKYLPLSGTLTTLPPPVTSILVPSTTPLSSDTPKTSANTDLKPENKTDRARHRQDLTSTHSRNQNVEYTTNLPPFAAPKTSFPISYTTPSSRGEVPSYIPPVRSFFTPPLPPEYANPFADKPTLRGSNSDGSITTMRRPLPPPRPPHDGYGRERIPLRPPDLGPEVNIGSSNPDRKKPLNTPSFNRSPESPNGGSAAYDSLDHETPSSSKPNNDTDFDFVPIINYPSVSRILSGSNGRKDFPDIRKPHVESRLPARVPPPPPTPEAPSRPPPPGPPEDPVVVPLPPGGQPPPPNEHEGRTAKKDDKSGLPRSIDVGSKVDSIVSGDDEKLPDPQPQPPEPPDPSDADGLDFKPSRKNTDGSWLLAWDIHVYLMASLFLVLAVCSLVNLARINSRRRLLGHGYYASLHSLLLAVGTLRALYLFLDPYNLRGLLSGPVSGLALNAVSPLITAAFLVLFLFVLRASKAGPLAPGLHHPLGAAVFAVSHASLAAALELAQGAGPGTHVLPLIGQCVYIVVLAVSGVVYLYVYKAVARSVATKTETAFGGGGGAAKPTIAVTVRAGLATALLALLMAAIQLYGVFGALDGRGAEGGGGRWLWWGYQSSVRVVEAAMCFTMLWAGVQSPPRCHGDDAEEEKGGSDGSGFALFRCSGRCADPRRRGSDDIYPAVCATNQAIHDYTLRTGRKVYDDAFPLGALHHYEEAGPPPPAPPPGAVRRGDYEQGRFKYDDSNFSTNERRSSKKVSPSYDSDDLCAARGAGLGGGGGLGKSGSFTDVNRQRRGGGERRPARRGEGEPGRSSTVERRSSRGSRTVPPDFHPPGGEARGSLRRGALPPPPHRGGAQTLGARNSPGSSMLVAENGFVRFRALQEPEEADSGEEMPATER